MMLICLVKIKDYNNIYYEKAFNDDLCIENDDGVRSENENDDEISCSNKE